MRTARRAKAAPAQDAGIVVMRPGALTTLQDRGRSGYQRYGVIASGAMDDWAHRVANLLVANELDEATLEITLLGPSLAFERDALVAITGADLTPRVGAREVPMNTPVLVRAGQRLEFGARRSGCRAYLAVHGGFAADPVMGSRSTYLRAGLGGHQGRALRKGDRLALAGPVGVCPYPGLVLALELSGEPCAWYARSRFARPRHPVLGAGGAGGANAANDANDGGAGAAWTVRALHGPQWGAFSDAAQRAFFGEPFEVAPESDRMGYRLRGPRLELAAPLEMISQPVSFGTVQVPPDGQPIVLMADRQTAGGYPRIAEVAGVDLPALAQRLPGEAVSFEAIGLGSAQSLWLERESGIEAVAESTAQLREH